MSPYAQQLCCTLVGGKSRFLSLPVAPEDAAAGLKLPETAANYGEYSSPGSHQPPSCVQWGVRLCDTSRAATLQAPELKSCNPGSMKFVTDTEEIQQVAENKEIIFSYDVLFRVCAALSCPVLPCELCCAC